MPSVVAAAAARATQASESGTASLSLAMFVKFYVVFSQSSNVPPPIPFADQDGDNLRDNNAAAEGSVPSNDEGDNKN